MDRGTRSALPEGNNDDDGEGEGSKGGGRGFERALAFWTTDGLSCRLPPAAFDMDAFPHHT